MMDVEDFSSEGEEDAKYPRSLRATCKRIVRECLQLGQHDSEEDELCEKLGKSNIKEIDRDATSQSLEVGMERLTIQCSTCDVKSVKKTPERKKDYTCPTCGHVFALAKTRALHLKVCVG